MSSAGRLLVWVLDVYLLVRGDGIVKDLVEGLGRALVAGGPILDAYVLGRCSCYRVDGARRRGVQRTLVKVLKPVYCSVYGDGDSVMMESP